MKRREKEGQGDEKFECEGKEEWARAIGRRGNSRKTKREQQEAIDERNRNGCSTESRFLGLADLFL